MSFKDHFSGHAEDYARYRPGYPERLFEWLASVSPARDAVWDCATGNGQAALQLARVFSRVTATDASREQIEAATACDNVEYAVAPAENSGLAPSSMDAINVAQALHWFDTERFYTHAFDVLRPGGVLLVSSYGLCQITPEIDVIVNGLYGETLDRYWPPERLLVEQQYAGRLPDWPVLASPPFAMSVDWALDDMIGYLGSWSALRRYRKSHHDDPLVVVREQLRPVWGAGSRTVEWPLFVHAARKPGAF
ncbi:MAG: class I SAM-dependent methyltransferase [Pseudomonadota bacterium]